MVDFPVVDTHLHLWDPDHLRYSWLDGIPLLNRRYLLDEYRQACGDVQVEQMVFVQCECDAGQHVQEAEWVSGLSRRDGRIRGIVANAPLEQGVKKSTTISQALARIPLIKGIRRLLQPETADFLPPTRFHRRRPSAAFSWTVLRYLHLPSATGQYHRVRAAVPRSVFHPGSYRQARYQEPGVRSMEGRTQELWRKCPTYPARCRDWSPKRTWNGGHPRT